jgi:hypothetical protein
MAAEVLNPRTMKVLMTKLTTNDLILSWNDVKTSRTTIWTSSEGADGHVAIVDVTEFDVIETESEVRDLKVSVSNLALAIRDATTNDVGDACIENEASEAVVANDEDDVEDFLEPMTTTLYDDYEKRTNVERDSYAFRNWSKRLVREDETILDAELEGRNLKARVNQDLEGRHMKVVVAVEQEEGVVVDDNLEEAEGVADSLAKDENWVWGVVGHSEGFEATDEVVFDIEYDKLT